MEEIEKIYHELSPTYHGRKDDYFGVAYITKRFNIPAEHAATFVNFKGENYGIDGFYHDKSDNSLYLFVFRWSDDPMAFKDALDSLGKDGMYRLFFSTSRLAEDGQILTSIKNVLSSNYESIRNIYINFVFNGDPIIAEQSKVLGFLRESVEDKKDLVDSYFKNRSRLASQGATRDDERHMTELILQYVSNEIAFGHSTSSRQAAEYIIKVNGPSQKIAGGENELTLVFLPLWQLYQMYTEMGERFFEKNIRSGLDDGNMTNYQIKSSLKKVIDHEELPENFTLYHNGIAMTAQTLEESLNGATSIRMVEPRILNGVQTVKILKQFIESASHSKKSTKKNKSNTDDIIHSSTDGDNSGTYDNLQQQLGKTMVVARIIRSPDDEFLKRVTINNNRQNPIMPWNLRANDLVQIQFEELFGKMQIYYERRQNAYNSLTDQDLESIGIEKGVIEIRKFAQTILAMQGHIDRISDMKEVFENERWYKDTFKQRYLQVDPRKFVLLYKIQYRLPSVIREIKNIGSERYSYAPKAKNLLWCLSIQGILNDPKFSKHLEIYGTSVTIEAGLTQILRRLASTQLRLILRDTLEKRNYRQNIEAGKLSFLHTKTTLEDCMKVATDKFGWDRLYL
jgi:hypothetical protein